MAKRRVAGRGRRVVAGLLVAFVLVASVVIWRRSQGIAQARELRELERQRRQLEAERARLERDIRLASSRSRLVPVAERLGLRMPLDSEIVTLAVPADRPSSPPQP
ncbi:MAG TPA: hypothetical protein VFS08_21035 [Gemmatimonadaceae bacterium]|nr:hypothetical protein [Gemmatimonadaceae bacterium]